MRAKSLALLVLALGCGLVASIGITQVMAKKGDKGGSGSTRTVFVVVEDLEVGKPITADKVKSEKWPIEQVPEDAPDKFEDIDGRLTKTMILQGEPIVERRLWNKGDKKIRPSLLIPPGYRAVPVKVDSVASAGFVQRDDRVDVLVYLPASSANASASMRTLLKDIRVFSINAIVVHDEDTGGPIRATTVELLLTPRQTHKVTLADKLGDLRLIPRGLGSEEDDQTDSTPFTAGMLFEGPESGIRGDDTLPEDLEDPEEVPSITGKFGDWLNKITQGDQGESDTPATAETVRQPTTSPALVQPPVLTEPEKTPNRYPMTVWIGAQSEEVWLEAEGDEADPSGMGGNWKTVDPNSFSIPSATTIPPRTPPATTGPSTTQPSTTESPTTGPAFTEPATPEPATAGPEGEPESFDQDSMPADETVDGNGETILEIDPGGDD